MALSFDASQYEIHWKDFSQWTRLREDSFVVGLCGIYLFLLGFAVFMLTKFRYNTYVYPFLIIASISLRIIFGLTLPLVYEDILILSPLIFFCTLFQHFSFSLVL